MIELNWTLILQFANFLILLIVLNAVLYKPLRNLMARRAETIDGSYRRAKDLEGQINDKMARYQEQLKEAKLRGNEEKVKFRQEAMAEEARLMGAAHEEASSRLQEIKSRVSAEAHEAAQALRAQSESLAEKIATKVLGRSL